MSIIRDVFAGGAERDAAKAQVKGINAGISTINDQQGQVRDDFRSGVETGDAARTREADFLGLNGVDAEQTANDNFNESPGQAFLRERGERSVTRNAAATGGLQGGNVLKALTKFGIGTAAQNRGEHMDRLRGVARSGDFATANQASIGSNLASSLAGLQVGKGKARATGILGSAGAIRNGIGRVAGAFV